MTFPIIPASTINGSYQISRSLRFRSSASAYLSRTPASAGNGTTWTWSAWVKRGSISTGVAQYLFSAGTGTTDTTAFGVRFNSTDSLAITSYTTDYRVTNAIFRDPSAWYHIVFVLDTTNATANNRAIIYVNGVAQTYSTNNTITQSTSYPINNNVSHSVGRWNQGAVSYFDGYLAEVNFIDGQALTPSSFGAFDTNGVWQPARYTGSYGTNGFYLNFSDNSGATATTIGKDSSGNSNNWTPNNISVTSGTTYDSMIDSPTNYADGGNGRGNYCVLNPLSGSTGTLQDGNLYYYGPTGWAMRTGTIALPASSKIYFEATLTAAPATPRGQTSAYQYVGVGLATNFNITGTSPSGNNVNSCMIGDGGYLNNFASSASDAGVTFVNGDVIGVAIDTGANTYAFYKNGGTAFASGTINVTSGTQLVPIVFSYSNAYGNPVLNFGQRPFAQTVPSGYSALNTQNLNTPTIAAGNKYFDATTYSGSNSASSVVNSGAFKPDFVWIKGRNGTWSHSLFDINRGVGNALFTNATNAEASRGLSSFNSDGFSLTGNEADTSASGVTYVGWQWKAGGTGVTNTSGSITSTVSANTSAGFSVVTYTGTGANATVGHGLGVVPSMIILKNRDVGTTDWPVWHSYLTVGNTVWINATNGQQASATTWNSTAPTSSVFSVGTAASSNGSGNKFVAYCFASIAGYSAFGSYTGNGSADGPMIFTGFRPRWVMIKNTDTAGRGWEILDTSRNTYNVSNSLLQPDSASAESNSSSYQIDFVSNGFKIRGIDTWVNASSGTYIYAAFCELPFKNSRAR